MPGLRHAAAAAAFCCIAAAARAGQAQIHDVLIDHAMIYDGSGGEPYPGQVAIDGDRIAYAGPRAALTGRSVIDARGRAVAPGFIDMMGHSEESLLLDGRAVSGLKQGVTLDVFVEQSRGPLTPEMAARLAEREGDLKYPVNWRTLDEYLQGLQRRGIAPNVASFVGEGEIRVNVLGEADVAPTAAQLDAMRALLRKSMEEGALGLTTALIYAPMNYAKTSELIAMAQESARCGGIYSAHMRSEGDHIEDAVQETIDIARASGAPAEIHHLKLMGADNWGKIDRIIASINAARAAGVRITADMYTYTAGGTSLDASMPPWVHAGGREAMLSRLRNPTVRAEVIEAMRDPHPKDWENLLHQAGPGGILILSTKHAALKPLIGKTLAEIAKTRNLSPEDAIVDLVIEDEAGESAAYDFISENNIRREIVLPWVSFGSDAESSAPEGVFLLSSTHPRAYGNFARVFAKYVRDGHLLSVQEAVRKLTALPAEVLSLEDRGRLRAGAFADVVIFDPQNFTDHSTFAKPLQFATGVSDVFINGKLALKDGLPTGAATGRVVRGRAWSGNAGGGCRASSKDWSWTVPAHPVAIVGATLIDVSREGRAQSDLKDSVVLIADGRILAVGDRKQVRLPAGTKIIKAANRFLIPGLIDGFGAVRTQGFADAYLYEGVTTVIVPTAPKGANVDGESSIVAPQNELSVLTGAPISGYSATGDIPNDHPWTKHRQQDRRLDRAELTAQVAAAAAAGHRIVAAGIDVWPDQLDLIVSEAHGRGLAVTAQLAFTSYPYAVNAGVDAFVRNDKYSLTLSRPQDFLAYADDPLGSGGSAAARAVCSPEMPDAAAFGSQLQASHTALMPTLSMEATADDVGGPNPWTLRSAAFVLASDLDDPVDANSGARPYLDSHPGRRDRIQTCARRKQEIDRRLHALGAVYLAGTATPSYGVIPGGGLHGEMRLLQGIGLTPREALAAATGNIADAFRLADRGKLEAGRRADLVILSADPRIDVAAVDAIAEVMINGKFVDRARLMDRAVARRHAAADSG